MPRARSLRTLSITTQSTSNARMASPTLDGPPSPTMSDATNASQLNFGLGGPEKIITRADLRNSLQAYETLLNTYAAYREALLHMSGAAAAFADAMGTCASLKGASYESGSRMQAASGLHYLMGNHWHVLSDSLDKKFEKPLRQHLENYRILVADRSAAYERALREKSRIIRQTEMENMNVRTKKKNRNLQTFREALAVLQRQVEELDEMRLAHYQDVMEHEEEVWDIVQGKVSLVVRSTLDVLDRFTAKASDPVIEPMLQAVPDPFDSYGPPKAEGQMFSILPPLGILNSTSSGANSARSSPHVGTVEVDSTPAFSVGTSAWAHNHASDGYLGGDTDWSGGTTSASPPTSSPERISTSTPPLSRSMSPPVPVRRHSDAPSVSSASGAVSARAHPRKSVSGLRKVLSVISESIPQASYGYGSGSRKTSQFQSQQQKPKSQPLPSASSLVRETSQDTIRNKALPKDPEPDVADHNRPDPDPDSDSHLADVSSETIGVYGSGASFGANGLTDHMQGEESTPNLQRSANQYDRPVWAVHSRGASAGSVTFDSTEGISNVMEGSRTSGATANVEWPRMDTPPEHDSPLPDRSSSDGVTVKASA